jgi:hypothetical protein
MDDGPAADAGSDAGADAEARPGSDAAAESTAGRDGEPPAGLVTVRGAVYGVALLWLAAVAAFGALQAAVYGATTAWPYLLLAVAAAALSVTAGYASLRAFGVK